ncbi:unnamed protein product, partial [Meganyctiphanes norvegica]
ISIFLLIYVVKKHLWIIFHVFYYFLLFRPSFFLSMMYQHSFSFMDFLFQHFFLNLTICSMFSLLSIFILFSNFFLSLGILLLLLGFFLGINLMHNMRRQLKRIFIHVSVFFSIE